MPDMKEEIVQAIRDYGVMRMAHDCEMSPTVVSEFVNGKRDPQLSSVLRMLDRLDVRFHCKVPRSVVPR